MITPKDFVGPLMELAQTRRGEFTEMKYLTESRCELIYELPLGEVSDPPFSSVPFSFPDLFYIPFPFWSVRSSLPFGLTVL